MGERSLFWTLVRLYAHVMQSVQSPATEYTPPRHLSDGATSLQSTMECRHLSLCITCPILMLLDGMFALFSSRSVYLKTSWVICVTYWWPNLHTLNTGYSLSTHIWTRVPNISIQIPQIGLPDSYSPQMMSVALSQRWQGTLRRRQMLYNASKTWESMQNLRYELKHMFPFMHSRLCYHHHASWHAMLSTKSHWATDGYIENSIPSALMLAIAWSSRKHFHI